MNVSEKLESILTTLYGVQGTVKLFENGETAEENIETIPVVMSLLNETLDRITDQVSALVLEIEHNN